MKIDYDTLEWHDHTRIKLSFTGNISDNCWWSCFVRFYSSCSFWLKEAITLSSGNCGRLPLGVQPMLPKFWFQLRIHEQIDMSLTHEINMNLHEQWGYAHNQNLPTQLMGAWISQYSRDKRRHLFSCSLGPALSGSVVVFIPECVSG